MEELLKLLGIQENPIVIYIGAICLVIIALANFSESILKLIKFKQEASPTIEEQTKKLKISRRGLIFSAISIGLVTAGGYVLNKFLKANGLLSFISKSNAEGYLIANQKTGIVHHSVSCSWHLPNENNQSLDFHGIKNLRSHKFRGLNIYEVMAKQYLMEQRLEEAAKYFKKAIEQTPERVHLYDHLAKIYGKQKKYILIQKLYENGIKKVISKMGSNPNKRQLAKVIDDIKKRQETIKVKYG